MNCILTIYYVETTKEKINGSEWISLRRKCWTNLSWLRKVSDCLL